MLKHQEISKIDSCLNKAADDEPIFVLRGKDPVIVPTIQAWIKLRSELENEDDEDKLEEASCFIEVIERWQHRKKELEQARLSKRNAAELLYEACKEALEYFEERSMSLTLVVKLQDALKASRTRG